MRLIVLMTLTSFCCAAQELYEVPANTRTRWSSFENPGAKPASGGKENLGAKGHAFDVIPARGKQVMLDVTGAGIINRIWLTVNERSPKMLRSIRLEMYWDNASTPAVSVPLGDFFGIGLGLKTAFESELFTDPEGRSFNAYVPMPFKTAARIEIVNDSEKPVHLFYDVNFLQVAKHDKPVYYFHAFWSRENKTKLGRDFEVLPLVKGRGRFLGMNVGVNTDSAYDKTWWGEGEVKIFLDSDAEFPTLIGTGTEDYIGTAWGQGAFANRFQGSPIANEKTRQWCFYRYHIPDPIFFDTQCKVTLQQIGGETTEVVRRLAANGAKLRPISVSGEKFIKLLELKPVPNLQDESFPKGWTNFYREDDVSATAYFYLDKPANELGKISSLEHRTKGMKDQ